MIEFADRSSAIKTSSFTSFKPNQQFIEVLIESSAYYSVCLCKMGVCVHHHRSHTIRAMCQIDPEVIPSRCHTEFRLGSISVR